MHAVTDNDSWEEWSGKIYPADPAYYNFTIKGASKEKYKIVDNVMTTYQFFLPILSNVTSIESLVSQSILFFLMTICI